MRILVVGAGIGGLTCAIALRQAGFEVEIAEKATSLEEVGAGISLWPNALAALGEIDLEDEVTSVGCEMPIASFRRPSGEHLRIFESDQVRRFLGGVPVLLHRGELQRVLLHASDGIPLTLGLRCDEVRVGVNEVEVQFADGSIRSADLVVGADGIRSAVRNSISPGRPRYVGLTGWRAVIEGHPLEDSWLTVGDGKQFLAAGLSEGRTYLAGVVRAPEGFIEHLTSMGPYLHDTFTGWHEPIGELIDSTPESSYIRDDFFDRPPPRRLCWDRIALIGDAAHPVTPDLGQGGCLAIEDAIVLARCLRIENGLDRALHLFERARLRRVRTIVFESHWMGQMFGSSNSLVEATRTAALRTIPASARLWSLAQAASRNAFTRRLPGGSGG